MGIVDPLPGFEIPVGWNVFETSPVRADPQVSVAIFNDSEHGQFPVDDRMFELSGPDLTGLYRPVDIPAVDDPQSFVPRSEPDVAVFGRKEG